LVVPAVLHGDETMLVGITFKDEEAFKVSSAGVNVEVRHAAVLLTT
jgi:hypothetical protein